MRLQARDPPKGVSQFAGAALSSSLERVLEWCDHALRRQHENRNSSVPSGFNCISGPDFLLSAFDGIRRHHSLKIARDTEMNYNLVYSMLARGNDLSIRLRSHLHGFRAGRLINAQIYVGISKMKLETLLHKPRDRV